MNEAEEHKYRSDISLVNAIAFRTDGANQTWYRDIECSNHSLSACLVKFVIFHFNRRILTHRKRTIAEFICSARWCSTKIAVLLYHLFYHVVSIHRLEKCIVFQSHWTRLLLFSVFVVVLLLKSCNIILMISIRCVRSICIHHQSQRTRFPLEILMIWCILSDLWFSSYTCRCLEVSAFNRNCWLVLCDSFYTPCLLLIKMPRLF